MICIAKPRVMRPANLFFWTWSEEMTCSGCPVVIGRFRFAVDQSGDRLFVSRGRRLTVSGTPDPSPAITAKQAMLRSSAGAAERLLGRSGGLRVVLVEDDDGWDVRQDNPDRHLVTSGAGG